MPFWITCPGANKFSRPHGHGRTAGPPQSGWLCAAAPVHGSDWKGAALIYSSMYARSHSNTPTLLGPRRHQLCCPTTATWRVCHVISSNCCKRLVRCTRNRTRAAHHHFHGDIATKTYLRADFKLLSDDVTCLKRVEETRFLREINAPKNEGRAHSVTRRKKAVSSACRLHHWGSNKSGSLASA